MGGTQWTGRFNPKGLRAARRRRGLTQRQLGELVGYDQAAIGKFENGRRVPSGPTLHKLTQALEVDITQLLRPSPIDLAVLRVRRGLSQRDVASALGVSLRLYQRIEGRQTTLHPRFVPRLAELLKVREHEVN